MARPGSPRYPLPTLYHREATLTLPPDPNVLLERARQARLLLADETFLSVIDDLSQYHLAAIVAAPPGPRGLEARDHHHLLHYALGEIAGELTGRVQTGEELEKLIQATDEDDDA